MSEPSCWRGYPAADSWPARSIKTDKDIGRARSQIDGPASGALDMPSFY
jgi:hypothetical protein